MDKRVVLVVLPIILVATVLAGVGSLPRAHAPGFPGGPALVCLGDASNHTSINSECPAVPFIFNGPFPSAPQVAPTQIRVGVYVNGSAGLNALDITLLANHLTLQPAGIDLTGTVLLCGGTPPNCATSPPSLVLECIGGSLVAGTVCSNTDSPDTIHVAAASAPGTGLTGAPTSGLLFTAIYNVVTTTASGGIPIGFQTGCSQTSVSPSTCVTLANGSTSPNPATVQGGTFDNSIQPAWVAMTGSASTVTALKGAAGVTVTITATAENGFPGTGCGGFGCGVDSIAFTASATSGFIPPTFSAASCATAGTSCTTVATFNTATAGSYTVTILGTYVGDALFTGVTLDGPVVIPVNVQDVGFTINGAAFSGLQNAYMAKSGGSVFAVTAQSLGGYTGSISYTETLGSQGSTGLAMTSYVNPAAFTLAAGATVTKFINVTAATNEGSAAVRINQLTTPSVGTHTSGTLTLKVSGFTISSNVTSISVNQGSSGGVRLSSTSLGNPPATNGFAGPLTLSGTFSGTPGGITVSSFQPLLTLTAGGSGNGNVSITGNTAGTYTLTLKLIGGSNNDMSNSTIVTVTVVGVKANTNTAVSSSANPSAFGQSVTLTASVTVVAPGTGTPTGTVTFLDGAATLGTGTLSPSGTATFSTSAFSVGSHSITASYGGDANFNPSTSTVLTQSVNKATTATTVTSSVNPSVFGQSVTFTATVAVNAPGAGSPTGTVQFTLDGVNFGSPVALSGGSATSGTTTTLSVGPHSVTAIYSGDTNFSTSTSGVLTQTVNKASTTTTVTSSANPSVFGQSLTFTATVTATAPGAGTPSGTVTFLDGTTTLGTGTISAGHATFTTSALSVGSHSITASYAGDTSFSTSTSAVVTQTVNKASTTTTLTSSVNPSNLGQSVTFTATVAAVSPGAGSPSGTVTFLDGTTTLGTGTLSAGVATFATSTLAVGPHSITASYGGDSNFSTSTSATLTQTVVQGVAATTTTVTSSANPSVFGQSVTFTANVAPVPPATGTPTGTVTFLDGTTTLGTGTLSGGTATFSTSALAVGSHTITGKYNGDTNFTGSTSTALTQTVNKATTTTTVASSANPSVFGQSVTFTATVAVSAPGAGSPSGTVTFLDGATTLGTGTLSAGHATFSTSTLTVGSHSITASYGGDADFNTSTSAAMAQTVGKASTTTTLASSANPSTFGQSVTFTATVASVAPGAGTPSGTVTFLDGTTTLGTGTLTGGAATFSTSTLSIGSHSITASYGGDADFNTSTSAVLTQTINQGVAGTTTTVSSSANPSVFGQSVTFTATVAPVPPATGTPTGTVTFLDGTTTLGTGSLTSGTATFSTSALAVGSHSITAKYGGDTNFNPSTSTVLTQTVNKASTTTTVASSVNPSVFGQSVTFTATVAVIAPGAGTPSGTVTFLDGTTTLGTGTLASGVATFATSTLSVGSHSISASYGGDANFNTSTSAALTQTINKAGTNTTLASSLNPSVFGQSVTFTATIAIVTPGTGSPSGTVTFIDGTTTLGTGTITSGTATFTTSSLGVGSHSITASYAGDANFSGSISAALIQTVQPTVAAATTTTVTSSTNPSVFGQSITFTATVAPVPPATGTPTGTVSFLDGTTTLGTSTLAGGTATFSTSALTVGSHSITAKYSGDTNFTGSTSTALTQTVNKANTSTTVTSSVNPCCFGQSVTFTATVAAVAPGAGTPTGTVNILDGTTTIGTCTLATGSCSTTTNTLSVGSHAITAQYAGDSSFNGSTSPALTQTVNKGNITVALTSSVNPSVFGQSVTFTATVTAPSCPGSSATPTGTVTFLDGTTTIGTGTLSSGTATLSTGSLAVGSHLITASYGGDGNFNAATSTAFTQTVNKANTSTTLTSSVNPSSSGQAVTFTATVAAVAPGAGTPTGTVTFLDGTATLGTGTLSGGAATFTTSTLTAGPHSITAQYGGDGNFNTSTSPVLTQSVGQQFVTVTLTSSANPSVFGQSVTFTATVTVTPPPGTPTGTVTFLDGTIILGTGTISSGTASLTTSTLAVGSHSITAAYSGDVNFSPATSAALTQTVNKASTTTTVASSANPSIFGQAVTFTATVSVVAPGAGTPSGTVAFLDGTSTLGTGTISGGTATFTTSALTVGSHSITASYGGDANFSTSTSTMLTQTVQDFTIAANPTTVTVNTGVAGTSTITLTTLGGFGGVVTLSANNVACALTPNSLTGSGTATLSCTFSSVQITTVTVTGMSGSLSHSATVTFNVSAQTSCGTGCSVSSDATIANAFSNSTNILFTATGQSGTTAFVDVTVPTASVPNINTLQVLVNGTNTPFTFTTIGTNFVIHFTLTFHSTFVINIVLAPPTVQTVLLTFSAFDADDLENGIGQLQVLVNGHLVVGIPSGKGTNDNATLDNVWFNFGPFDITGFINNSQVQQVIVFRDPQTSDHFALIKSVTITQGNTVLLHVERARGVYPGHSVTYTFSIPPLVLTSFTASPTNPAVDQAVTFTATFTGGTAPFLCIFLFGDQGGYAAVTVTGQSCSAVHHYDGSGNFTAFVIVRGSSTPDLVFGHLSVTVSGNDTAVVAPTLLLTSDITR